MPLLNLTNTRAQEASASGVIGTIMSFIGNTTHGVGVFLTGATAKIPVETPTYLYKLVTADTQLLSTPGVLHSVTFTPNDAAATAGSIIVFDSAVESGEIVLRYDIPAAALVPFTVTLDVDLNVGLYIGFTTVADVNVTVAFR